MIWIIDTLQLRKMLDLLVHASQCRSPQCLYPNCRKVKGLFRHGIQCKTRASGGCVLCKKMWYLLQLHSRACKESECHVPRCRCVVVDLTSSSLANEQFFSLSPTHTVLYSYTDIIFVTEI